MIYLGNFKDNAAVRFKWATNDANGAAITRSTPGTIKVYKMDGLVERTAGITDTLDFDGMIGVHHCAIVTTDVFYETGNDYQVVIVGAIIEGRTVNAVIAHFSIENRSEDGLFAAITASQAAVIAEVDVNEVKIDGIQAKTDNLPNDPADASNVAAGQATLAAEHGELATEHAALAVAVAAGNLDADFIRRMEEGKWEITDEDGGTMIFYEDDNTTEVARFALYDENGVRTNDPAKIVRRDRL